MKEIYKRLGVVAVFLVGLMLASCSVDVSIDDGEDSVDVSVDDDGLVEVSVDSGEDSVDVSVDDDGSVEVSVDSQDEDLDSETDVADELDDYLG